MINSRNSALLLTPPTTIAEDPYPLTPPPTTCRSKKRPNRQQPEQIFSPEVAGTSDRSKTDLSTNIAPFILAATSTHDIGAQMAARLQALREHLEAGVLPYDPTTIEDILASRTNIISDDPEIETIARLEALCGNVYARTEQLEELMSKEARLDERDAILSRVCPQIFLVFSSSDTDLYQIIQARNEAITCPINGSRTENMHMYDIQQSVQKLSSLLFILVLSLAAMLVLIQDFIIYFKLQS
jgi:hypothetical protein